MLLAPPLAGVAIAYPLWQRSETILGNIAGTVVIFAAAIGMILREHVELDRITRRCLEAGYTCWPNPSAFARFAIYAAIGMIEVFALFTYSLTVERRIRRRGYAPEWR